VGGTSLFFNDWQTLGRTLVVGVLAYVTLVVLLLVSGKRTLSKMNAFDLIVTVALGSTLASVLTSKEVALAQGALAFAVLVGMQFIITWLSVRSGRVSDLVKAEPRLLLHRGEFLRAAMRHERVTEAEVRAAVRGQGVGALDDIDAVILETDGSFSVIRGGTSGRRSSLDGVQGERDD